MRTRLFSLLIFLCLATPTWSAEGLVPNQGQWKASFAYKALFPEGALYLEQGAFTFHLVDQGPLKAIHHGELPNTTLIQHHAFRIHFEDANMNAAISGYEELDYYQNYYLGSDNARWKTRIRPVQRVQYEDLYPGIDLWVIYEKERLKYEFHLDAGADPDLIRMTIEGLDETMINRDGDLILRTAFVDLLEKQPVAYQTKGDRKLPIQAAFELNGSSLTYALDDHEPSLPLVIDPEIVFSTYTGAGSDNWGFSATPDNDGNLYAGGIILANNYPTTTGSFDQNFNGGDIDITITKFNNSGTGLIYSTFLGGNGNEQPHSMIVNDLNNLYVMGATSSNNFPVSANAFQEQLVSGGNATVTFSYAGGCDLFITGFNSDGTALLGSTYYGGSDVDGLNLSNSLAYGYAEEFRGEIDLDDDDFVYIVSSTYSDDIPTTEGAFQIEKSDVGSSNRQEGVIAKFNPSLTDLEWASYFGSNNDEGIYSIDIANNGSIYIAGGSNSIGLRGTTPLALYPTYRGGRSDGFVAHISSEGDTLYRSTYYGTQSYDQVFFIQVDRDGNPTLFGQTEHSGSNLIFNVNYSDQGGGQIFAALTPDLSDRIWATQFGGNTPGRPNMHPTAFLVDVCNSIYFSGWGGDLGVSSTNNMDDVSSLPVTQDAFQSTSDPSGHDFYVGVLSAGSNSLEFGSFYGGNVTDDHVDGGTSRFDRSGKIYHSVCASCGGFDDFPIVPDPGAWSASNNSQNCNNAVFKIDFQLPIIVADFNIPDFACAPFTTTLQNNSVAQSNTTFFWDLGNGQTSTSINPSVTYTTKGSYEVMLVVNDPQSCNFTDTITKIITIAQDTNYVLPDLQRCVGGNAVLGPDPDDYLDIAGATISWQPDDLVSNPNILNPSTAVNNTTTFRLVIDYGGCQERILQDVVIDRYPIETYGDTIICSDFTPFEVYGTAFGAANEFAWSHDPEFNSTIDEDSVLLIDQLTDPITRFYFRTTKDNGCVMYDTLTVTQSDLDLYLTSDTTICRNELFRVEARSENPLNTFDYYWFAYDDQVDSLVGLAPIDQSFVQLTLDSGMTIYLQAYSNKILGCNVFDTVQIEVVGLDASNVLASASVDTFYRGQLIQLEGEPSSGNITFTWSPTKYMDDPNSPSPHVRPKEATNYVWTVTDNENEECSFSDTVSVTPYEILCDTPNIYLPTAFSPNGDGLNDVLRVEGNDFESMLLIIHDRWGNEVFRSEDQSIGWDGTYKGQQADKAIYVYQLEVTCPTKEVYQAKGNISKLD